MILAPEGKRGIFAWKDEGSRPRKRSGRKGQKVGEIQKWSKIWFSSVFKSERHPDMPWCFGNSGGKYPFCRMHIDTDMFPLLLELIPFLYKEFFGVSVPWSTPVEIKKEFKVPEDDEVTKLMKELAGLRA